MKNDFVRFRRVGFAQASLSTVEASGNARHELLVGVSNIHNRDLRRAHAIEQVGDDAQKGRPARWFEGIHEGTLDVDGEECVAIAAPVDLRLRRCFGRED